MSKKKIHKGKKIQIEDCKVVENVLLRKNVVDLVNAKNNSETNFFQLEEQKLLNNQKANKYSVDGQEYQCDSSETKVYCVLKDSNQIAEPKHIQIDNQDKTLFQKSYDNSDRGINPLKFSTILHKSEQKIINEQIQKNDFKKNLKSLKFNVSIKSQQCELIEHQKIQNEKEFTDNIVISFKSQLCNKFDNDQMKEIFLQQNSAFVNQVVNDVWMGKALTVQGALTEISDNFETNYFIFRSTWSPLAEDCKFWINFNYSLHKNNKFPIVNIAEIPESLKTSDSCGRDCYFGNGRKLYF